MNRIPNIILTRFVGLIVLTFVMITGCSTVPSEGTKESFIRFNKSFGNDTVILFVNEYEPLFKGVVTKEYELFSDAHYTGVKRISIPYTKNCFVSIYNSKLNGYQTYQVELFDSTDLSMVWYPNGTIPVLDVFEFGEISLE